MNLFLFQIIHNKEKSNISVLDDVISVCDAYKQCDRSKA